MIRTVFAGAALAATALAAPDARADDMVARYDVRAQLAGSVPQTLSDDERRHFGSLFAAIDAHDWPSVERLIAQRPSHPLSAYAEAEYMLDADSPPMPLERIERWLGANTALPQAERLVALGRKRGLAFAPYLPPERALSRRPGATKRLLPRTIRDGTMPEDVRLAILDRIKNDDPDGARQLLDGIDASLSPAARAEWRRRVAWSYFIENDDRAALAMARRVGQDGSGPWLGEGEWVAGLASWRLGDCDGAGDAFQRAAVLGTNAELIAAARYWAARSLQRCRKPDEMAEQLRAAAALDQTLYGLLARERLGQAEAPSARFDDADWQRLASEPTPRAAVSLAQLGRLELADDALRHHARTGDTADYAALSRLARALGLPATQLWMAHNAPGGAAADDAARYPVAAWRPVNGWRVDPALAYAHALQESNFRPAVVSPAGARGLMQIMPAAAQDHAGALGLSQSASALNQPEVNLAYGQRHLQMLAGSPATRGALPKVMAAYNAGLSPVSRWNSEVRDQGDPLMWMEAIPYWETRGYVAIVMRNYWMYQRQAGAPSPERRTLAQNEWPAFPAAR